MLKKQLIAVLFWVLVIYAGSSQAAASFIPAANRSDMVYDFRRNQIYIADGNQVLRYAVGSNRLLSAIPLGSDARSSGIDISRDGSTLAVADLTSTSTQGWVHLINLGTLVDHKTSFDKGGYDSGTWSVAFTADNHLLVSSEFNGSGWVPLRRLDLSSGQWVSLGDVRHQTMLAPSTDRNTIAFAEADISDGRWGLYDVPTGQLVRREWYEDGTSAFNFDIATDALGGQFAIPIYAGMYVYDATYQKIISIASNDHGPLGVAYHPVQHLIYYPWSGTRQMRVYSSNLGRLVAWYDMGDVFSSQTNRAYIEGRTRLSADGSLLMVTAPGGVRYLRMYAPLTAQRVSATVATAVRTKIGMKGAIGNHGPLSYQLWGSPRHGRVTVSGSTAYYTSAAGYKGTDSFRYMVRYGAAAYAVGTVAVNVK